MLMKYNIMKGFIKRLLREGLINENEVKTYESKNEFYSDNNINPDNLSYLGTGDFGEAYSIGDGRVLKKTSSHKEFEIATELVGRNVSGLANIYSVGIVKLYNYPATYYIVLEELEEDSSIEDMWYEMSNILDEQGFDISTLHYIDSEELGLEEDMVSFISDIEDIYRVCRNNGIVNPDIRPENLGRDKHGNIKLFDIDDKNRR